MKKISCREAYEAIKQRLTKSNVQLSKEFEQRLSVLEEAGDNYVVYYDTIKAPENVDILKRVIGKDGYYFKLTTLRCDLDFIWHNREDGVIEFWGASCRSIKDGKYEIEKRERKVKGIS